MVLESPGTCVTVIVQDKRAKNQHEQQRSPTGDNSSGYPTEIAAEVRVPDQERLREQDSEAGVSDKRIDRDQNHHLLLDDKKAQNIMRTMMMTEVTQEQAHLTLTLNKMWSSRGQ